MIVQIAKKEIRHNLYTIRFPALLVISAILFALNGILAVTEPVEEKSEPGPSTTGVTIRRKPDALQFCVRGTNADRIWTARVDLGGAIKPRTMGNPASLPSGDHLGGFALPHADRLDWTFIIKMIESCFWELYLFMKCKLFGMKLQFICTCASVYGCYYIDFLHFNTYSAAPIKIFF